MKPIIRTLALPSVLVLVSCGSGSDHPPDAAHTADAAQTADARPPDAAVPDAAPPDAGPLPDSMVPTACTMKPSYDTLTIGSVGVPLALPAQVVDGNFAIFVFGNLTPLDGGDNHGILFDLIDNLGMFAGNPFSGGPTVTAAPLDGGDTCGGCMSAYGGFVTAPGGGPDLPTATQVYLPDSGTLTLTTFDPLVSGGSSHVFGRYDNVTMTGYDAITGVPLDPACTTSVTQLSFFFDVTWTPPVAGGLRHAPLTD